MIVITLVIQLICCRYIKNKYLRHAGLIVCAVPLVISVGSFFPTPVLLPAGT